MSQFRLSRQAVADLDGIWDYLAINRGSPQAAYNQLESLYSRFILLAESQFLGEQRDDLRAGLRMFSVDQYVVFYYVIPDGIEVAGVIHGSRDIEGLFRRGER
jgi:toxin ParE1/3/4